MPSNRLRTAQKIFGWTTLTFGALSVAVVAVSYMRAGEEPAVEAALVKQPAEYPWAVIEAEEVSSGALISANTHTVFHLPETFDKIVRETLFGHKGKTTRYWGYCFPANYDPRLVDKRRGFPGLIFLSEKERAVRAAQLRKPAFTISQLPTAEEVANMHKSADPPIRHQLEVFEPSTMCYIMSESSLAIGLDPDGDRLNNKLEAELGTNPQAPDSDGDGLIDGIEYRYHTIPTIRDTDGDGLIDGIEDTNWNGRINSGETDPRVKDTDRDGLCDGICRTKLKRRDVFMGEDKNLNGDVDEGESDPNKWDSNGDGISDQIPYLQCIAQGLDDCP